MVELQGNGLSKEVTVNKFNIADLSEAELAQDIDYIMHVEHELPMEWYTQLDKIKADLVKNAIIHADAAVRRALRDVSYQVAKRLQEQVGEVVLGAIPELNEQKTVTKSTDLSNLMGSSA